MKRVFILTVLLLSLGAFYFLLSNNSSLFDLPKLQSLKDESFDVASPQELLQELERTIFAPPPLRVDVEAPSSFLTANGVVEYTNIQRSSQGLVALQANEQLSVAAAAKVEDMFKQQYFAHVSPKGQSAGDLATLAGYEYITVGENLALGNFENDEKLVEAWMNSPGHRANILNGKYQEIGVAVGKSTFEGSVRWLAVQIFGKPLSSCPSPSSVLKAEIEEFENSIDVIQQNIAPLRQELEETRQKRGDEYNQKVDEYNALVSQYNLLIEETKKLVVLYNQQVSAFNACIGQ